MTCRGMEGSLLSDRDYRGCGRFLNCAEGKDGSRPEQWIDFQQSGEAAQKYGRGETCRAAGR